MIRVMLRLQNGGGQLSLCRMYDAIRAKVSPGHVEYRPESIGFPRLYAAAHGTVSPPWSARRTVRSPVRLAVIVLVADNEIGRMRWEYRMIGRIGIAAAGLLL